MTILLPVLLLALILACVAVWTRAGKKKTLPGPAPGGPLPAGSGERDEDHPVSRFTGKGPPSAGQGLDALRARLADLPTESLQEMLDMGAAFKPGAEALIQDELDRRRESE